jgi:AAA family ATP:ADP antiporter
MTAAPPRPLSPLERLLHVVAPVEPREGPTVLLMTLNVFLLLTAYYVLKVLREPLILVGGGAELKSYASAGQALLLLVVVPIYGRLASRVSRSTLLTAVLLFFIVCLVTFYVLVRAGVPLGLVFYVWLGMFSVMVVATFWSFANDIYTPEQGKRLFAIVAFGGSAGSIAGAFLPERLGQVVGTYELFLVAAAILAVAIFIFRMVNARESHEVHPSGSFSIPRSEAKAPLQSHGGFALVMRDRYLRLVALLIFLSTVVNTTGEYVVGKMVEQGSKQESAAAVREGTIAATPAAIKERERGYVRHFYSNYFGVVNLVSAVLQALAVSRIIRLLGIGRGLLVMPVVVLFGWLTFAAFATIATIRITKTVENSIDYSLQNTLKQALYLPTSRESKYKAKAVIDGFIFRFGDVVAAFGLVYLFAQVLSLGLRTVALINAVFVVAWMLIAFRTWRLHDQRTAERAERAALGMRETAV